MENETTKKLIFFEFIFQLNKISYIYFLKLKIYSELPVKSFKKVVIFHNENGVITISFKNN